MSSESATPSRSTTDALLNSHVVSVAVAASMLGIGRNAAYRAVKAGSIPSFRVGGQIRVSTAGLRRMLGLEGV